MMTLARLHQERFITDDGVILDASGQEIPVDSLHKRYMTKTSTALGILMILGGELSIILGVVAIVKGFTLAYIGTGVWVGLLFHVSTGILGIVAGRIKHMNVQNSSTAVNAFFAMCMGNICSGCAAQLILGAIAATYEEYDYDDNDEEIGDGVSYIFDVTFIIISLLEAFFCVFGIIIASKATYCRCLSTGYVTGTATTEAHSETGSMFFSVNLGAELQPGTYYPEQPPAYEPPQPNAQLQAQPHAQLQAQLQVQPKMNQLPQPNAQPQAQPGMNQPPHAEQTKPQAQPLLFQPEQQPTVH